MDDRTTAIARALYPPNTDVLLSLLGAPATEKELTAALGLGQSTINRRLTQLAQAGLVSREPGKAHTPNLAWHVNHAQEIDALLQRLIDLADSVEAASQAQRADARSRLAQARARRLGIRDIGTSR